MADPPHSTVGALDEDGFRLLVEGEAARDERRLGRLEAGRPFAAAGWALVGLLLAFGGLLMALTDEGLLLWLVCAFLLYSFNFVVLLLPTTRNRDEGIPKLDREMKRPLAFLLRSRKKLAAEVGAVMFLGGLYPLAYAFFVLLGMGLSFGLYYVLVQEAYPWGSAGLVLLQMVIILGYFGLMLWLKPHERGISRKAKNLQAMMAQWRSSGRIASFLFMSSLALVASVVGLMAAGAILFTGLSLKLVYEGLMARQGEALLGIILVLAMQLVIMRRFQMAASQEMARKFLRERLRTLREEVLAPLGRHRSGPGADAPLSSEEFGRLKAAFYSAQVFDMVEHDFFGRWPIYVMAPRLKYLLDQEALEHLG